MVRVTRLLLVTHTPPLPATNGGHQRSQALLRALATLGHVELVLLPRRPTPRPPEAELAEMEALCHRVHYLGYRLDEPRSRAEALPLAGLRWCRRARHALAGPRWLFRRDPGLAAGLSTIVRDSRPDLVVARYLNPAILAGALDHQPCIVDLDDVDSDRIASRLAAGHLFDPQRLRLHRQLSAMRAIETRALPRAAHLWVCSELDRRALAPPVQARTSVLANIPFGALNAEATPECLPDSGTSQDVLLVGSLRYTVNLRSIEYFTAKIWPKIHQRCPGARLRIVGHGLHPLLRAHWARRPGVVPVGFVDDLKTEYRRCAFAVAPIYEGGGTKIKVAEAMRHGRSCVASRHALRGYREDFRHREALWHAEDDAQMLEGCVTLLRDRALRSRMAKTAFALVIEKLSFAAFCDRVAEDVRSALLHGAASRGMG